MRVVLCGPASSTSAVWPADLGGPAVTTASHVAARGGYRVVYVGGVAQNLDRYRIARKLLRRKQELLGQIWPVADSRWRGGGGAPPV